MSAGEGVREFYRRQGASVERERITEPLKKEIKLQQRTVFAAREITLNNPDPVAVGDRDYSEGFLAGLERALQIVEGENK